MIGLKKTFKTLSEHTNFYMIGCSILTVITVFFVTKSLGINEKEHGNYQEIINEQIQDLFLIKEDLLKLANLSDSSSLLKEDIIKSNSNNQQLLDKIPQFINEEKKLKITDKVRSFLKKREEQKQLIEELIDQREKNRIAWNSLSFAKQKNARNTNLTSYQKEIAENIDILIDNLLAYQLNPNDFLLSDINYRKELLRDLKQQNLPRSDSLIITQSIVSTENIIQIQPQIKKLLLQLNYFSTLSELEEINQAYYKFYIDDVKTVYNYRLKAGLSLLVLSLWTSYKIIMGLKKTNGNIVKVLENFTTELEDKVEERTSQLEASVEKTEMALSRAKEANEAKSRFLANMSHELRTPLNAILGFTQLMSRDSSLSSGNKESLDIINRSGEHLLKLINDILEMSKIEAGRITLEENEFDFFLMLKSIEEMLQLKAKFKNLKLTFTKNSNVPQFIKADEGKLRQTLINILGNAIKFTDKGQVNLRVKLEKKQQQDLESIFSDMYFLHCEIEDTGVGIEAENLDKLFTPFEQTKSGRSSQEGTGLGLSICKKFIELMGGEIKLKSTVGKGTIFKFNILVTPVVANTIQSNRYKQVVSLAPNQPSYRILAVDDRPESRFLLRKMLSNVGFEVNEAANGQEAIDLWKSWQPHLIFMDMQMPIIDGYEATKKIKSYPQGEEAVIIALTASAFEEERMLILSAGCNDFMRKPFYEGELFDKIAYHLGVNFIYEDDLKLQKEAENVSKPKEDSSELTQADIDIMPESWQLEMYQAAEQVDNSRIYQLIAEIPAEYTFLSEKLTNLVKHFRCDTIIDLIEPTKVTK